MLGGSRDPLEGAGEEVRFHLQRQAEDLVAEGWSEDEAWAEARRRFGDPERIERRLERMGRRRRTMAKGTAWWDAVRRDVGFTFRQMRRRPAFAAATVVVLALGVGMASAVFAVVDAALLRPLPFRDPDALIAMQDVQDRPGYPASMPEYHDWVREGADILAASTAFVFDDLTLRLGDVPERGRVGIAAGDFVGTVGLQPIVGRAFTEAERNPAGWEGGVVLVDEDFWRDHLGADPSVVGRPLEMNGIPFTVVGVMPREARLLAGGGSVAAWTPFPNVTSKNRGLHQLTVVARLAPGVDVAGAEPRVAAIAAGLKASGVTTDGVVIRPLRDELLGDTHRVALVLAGAALLVLLVVCANLAHLFLAQGWSRHREFAVRGALGAGRGGLVRQLVTETTLLGLLGGGGGVLVARGITGWVARAAGSSPVQAMTNPADPRVLLFALGTSLVLGIVFGWGPAHRAANEAPANVLRGATTGTAPRRVRLRRALVGVEVALSAVLLTGAGLLVRTVSRLVHEDMGFSATGILTATVDLPQNSYPTPESRISFWSELTGRLEALPGVGAVTTSSHLPFRGGSDGDFAIVGRDFPNGKAPHTNKAFASRGYFETMGIPIVRGRGFLPSDRRGEPEVAVISESLARQYWPGEDPIGKRIRFMWVTSAEQEIVGVVGDVRTRALDREGVGTIYVDNDQIGRGSMSLILRTQGPPAQLTEPLRRTVASLDPERAVYNVGTLDALVRGSVANRTTVMQLLGVFAALALLLAGVGVYAVASQSVLSRRREIGLRIAVGAHPGGVVKQILGEELRPVLLGLALGVAGSAVGGRALAGMLYEVAPSDPGTLSTVAVVLLVAAVLALAVPALRASRVDPADALRTE